MDVFDTKVCPQCGQELFSDMGVCYGCLYSFDDARREMTHGLADLPDFDEPDFGDDGAKGSPESGPEGMMLKISTGDAQATIPVPKDGLVIGRDALSDVVLKSRAVSKRHVRVIPLSNAIIVEDLGSTNPALYKGREVRETAVVHVGESFEICGTVCTVV